MLLFLYIEFIWLLCYFPSRWCTSIVDVKYWRIWRCHVATYETVCSWSSGICRTGQIKTFGNLVWLSSSEIRDEFVKLGCYQIGNTFEISICSWCFQKYREGERQDAVYLHSRNTPEFSGPQLLYWISYQFVISAEITCKSVSLESWFAESLGCGCGSLVLQVSWDYNESLWVSVIYSVLDESIQINYYFILWENITRAKQAPLAIIVNVQVFI